MRKFYLSLLFISIIFSGCSIKQTVEPVQKIEGKKICIIENLKVQSGFLKAYEEALSELGYVPIIIFPHSNLNSCENVSKYTANWRWDLAMYLAYVKIEVYKNGKKEGEAIYDSLSASMNMSKFINGEVKIKELIRELYPPYTPIK